VFFERPDKWSPEVSNGVFCKKLNEYALGDEHEPGEPGTRSLHEENDGSELAGQKGFGPVSAGSPINVVGDERSRAWAELTASTAAKVTTLTSAVVRTKNQASLPRVMVATGYLGSGRLKVWGTSYPCKRRAAKPVPNRVTRGRSDRMRPATSVIGTKQTCESRRSMSAHRGEADSMRTVASSESDPKRTCTNRSFDHLVGAPGITAATPSGLMLKAKNVRGVSLGFPH
jgi:hypothetical protein